MSKPITNPSMLASTPPAIPQSWKYKFWAMRNSPEARQEIMNRDLRLAANEMNKFQRSSRGYSKDHYNVPTPLGFDPETEKFYKDLSTRHVMPEGWEPDLSAMMRAATPKVKKEKRPPIFNPKNNWEFESDK